MRDRFSEILKPLEIDVSDGVFLHFLKEKISSALESWKKEKEMRIEQICCMANDWALRIRPPAGRVGAPYPEQTYALPEKLREFVKIQSVLGLDGIGISAKISEDGNAFSLGGVPVKDGGADCAFGIVFEYVGTDIPQELVREKLSPLRIRLVINPDPRTLWKDLPTPEETRFFKEDVPAPLFLSLASAQRNIVGASRRGRSHANEARPRDDDFSVRVMKEQDWQIMIVADGAGSAKFSREGSRIACDVVQAACAEKLAGGELDKEIRRWHESGEPENCFGRFGGGILYEILVGAAHAAFLKIKEVAKNTDDNGEKCAPRDFATTLLLTISKKFDFGWAIASFWVGDGAICLYNGSAGTSVLMGKPDGGEYAGQTRFLTMPEIFADPKVASRLRFRCVKDFTALFLMTDGVSDAKFESDADLENPQKWTEFWNELCGNDSEKRVPVEVAPPDVETNGTACPRLLERDESVGLRLRAWLNFWSRGNHDDRTIVILY